jgi:sugar phosphate isomerase/epimerase
MSEEKSLNRRDALKVAALGALSIPLFGVATDSAAENTSSIKKINRASALKLGIASFSLAKSPIEEVIAVLKKLEINGVALYKIHAPWADGTPEECKAVVQKFADAGITVTSTGVIEFTNEEAAARKAFENVRAGGLKTLCGRPTVDALPLVEKLVKEYDIKVAIHNHGPMDLYPTGDDVWKAIQPYDKRIGLCLDVGHAWRAGADPVAEIRKCHERLYEVHLKDTNGPKGGGVTKDPSPVIVGHGSVDIRGIISALVELKFPHQVEFEYEPKVEDKLPGLAESVGYVRGLLAGMAI